MRLLPSDSGSACTRYHQPLRPFIIAAANRPSTSRRGQKQNSIARRARPRRMSETPRIPDADRRRLIESIEQHGGGGACRFDKDPDSCVSARGRSAGLVNDNKKQWRAPKITLHLPPIRPRQNNNKLVRQIPRIQSMMIRADFFASDRSRSTLKRGESRRWNAWLERTREIVAWAIENQTQLTGGHCTPVSLIAQSTLARARGSR